MQKALLKKVPKKSRYAFEQCLVTSSRQELYPLFHNECLALPKKIVEVLILSLPGVRSFLISPRLPYFHFKRTGTPSGEALRRRGAEPPSRSNLNLPGALAISNFIKHPLYNIPVYMLYLFSHYV